MDEALALNVCRAVHMFALVKLRESVPDAPPRKKPAVPEYDRDAPIVGVDVPVVFNVPLDPAV